ncbi:hypothetical protein VTP01DRAFT_2386 [Rhizomucor pusillus]|uniref:uncharacterized protein n=1 Tax=Rhizomucor pusillus TaxID=4840 RepID=UPI003743745A
MSNQCFYEDGQGHVVDEHGRPEPMDCAFIPMHIEDAKDADVRMAEAAVKRTYTTYTDHDKVRFFKLMFEKVKSAPAAAKHIFMKPKRSGRPRILNEEHKKVILDYIDENPSAVLDQLMERLLQSMAWSKKGTPAVVTVPKTRARTHNHDFRCNISLRRDKLPEGYNGRDGQISTYEGPLAVMDNAPIHKSDDISKYVESRGYQCAYLPSYSPELNPIEQFWSVVKSKVKRNRFLENETLMTRSVQ